MDINERLYVEICPLTGPAAPQPDPITAGHFDPNQIYKVLGMYNPSETSECYFILSNPERQIWFISQRHLRAAGLFDSDELSLPKPTRPLHTNGNGHHHSNGNGHAVLSRIK